MWHFWYFLVSQNKFWIPPKRFFDQIISSKWVIGLLKGGKTNSQTRKTFCRDKDKKTMRWSSTWGLGAWSVFSWPMMPWGVGAGLLGPGLAFWGPHHCGSGATASSQSHCTRRRTVELRTEVTESGGESTAPQQQPHHRRSRDQTCEQCFVGEIARSQLIINIFLRCNL